MKIATFNINNVRKRLPNLLAWLADARPDIVCLQELKTGQRDFPEAALAAAGYQSVWRGQKQWNGVAILVKGSEPMLTRDFLPGNEDDRDSRYIEAACKGVLVASLYLPNGNPQPGPKFAAKLSWFERLIAHADQLLATGLPVVLAGDFNVAPTGQDIYPTNSWNDDALVHPETRAAYVRLVDQGWTDALRHLHPDLPMYTFWSYQRRRWGRDAGLRLDHLLISPSLATRLIEAGVDRDVRGAEEASDHAPAWVLLKEQSVPAKAAGKKKPASRG